MENWKPVVGYEGAYEVSDAGRVRSLNRLVPCANGAVKKYKGRLLVLKPNCGGYLSLRLGRGNPAMVHQLVAAAFIGPADGRYVCHNDGDKTNNAVSNLRHDSPKGNQDDRVEHGTLWHGSMIPWAKLDEVKVRQIKLALGTVRRQELADKFGVCLGSIHNIAAGKSWKHVRI